VVLVLVVHGVGEVLVAGLRESVLLVQDVQHAHHLGLHQVCGRQNTTVGVWWKRLRVAGGSPRHGPLNRMLTTKEAWRRERLLIDQAEHHRSRRNEQLRAP